MKITVLGCGSIGQLWLTALYKHGHDIQGWLRVPQQYCNINMIENNGNRLNLSIPANNSYFLAQSDLLLITLKAWQVSYAVKNIATKLPVTSPILLLHNGMGTVEELENINNPLIVGTTTHAAYIDINSKFIIHVASGITNIGSARKQIRDYSYLADMLNEALPVVKWHNNISQQLLLKLAVNCVINPLTALFACNNGELLKNHKQDIAILCAEIARVTELEGLHKSADDLQLYVEQVIENTAENISSMLQDIQARRYTEIDYITGYLLKIANSKGINLPENTRLYELIKCKEMEYAQLSKVN